MTSVERNGGFDLAYVWAAQCRVGFRRPGPFFDSGRTAASEGHGTSEPMELTATSADAPPAEIFFDAYQYIGCPVLDDVDGSASEGSGTYDLNVVDGKRFSVAHAFLLPLAGRPNLTIVTNAGVEALIASGTHRCALPKRKACLRIPVGLRYRSKPSAPTTFKPQAISPSNPDGDDVMEKHSSP